MEHNKIAEHEDYLKSKYYLCATLITTARKVLAMNGGHDIRFTTIYDNEKRDGIKNGKK